MQLSRPQLIRLDNIVNGFQLLFSDPKAQSHLVVCGMLVCCLHVRYHIDHHLPNAARGSRLGCERFSEAEMCSTTAGMCS